MGAREAPGLVRRQREQRKNKEKRLDFGFHRMNTKVGGVGEQV